MPLTNGGPRPQARPRRRRSWRGDLALLGLVVVSLGTLTLLASRLEPKDLQLATTTTSQTTIRTTTIKKSEPCSGSRWLNGTDLPGGDLQTGRLTDSSAESCCAACVARPDCVGWTWLPSKTCWLKGKLAATKHGATLISGVVPGRVSSQKEMLAAPPKTSRETILKRQREQQQREKDMMTNLLKSIPLMPRDARRLDEKNCSCTSLEEEEWRLTADSEARDWTEAYPIGNGKLGLLVGMEAKRGRIPIADESLFELRETIEADKKAQLLAEASKRAERKLKNAETPEDRAWALRPKSVYEAFQVARAAMLERDVDKLHRASKYLDGGPVASFQGLATLNFVVSTGIIRNYERILDLDRAIASASFSGHKREAFASNVDDVAVFRFQCEPVCSVVIDFERAENSVLLLLEKKSLLLKNGDEKKSLAFAACARWINNGTFKDKKLLANGTDLVLLVAGLTSYQDVAPEKACLERLDKAEKIGYAALKKRHVDDIRRAAGETRLSLRQSKTNNCKRKSTALRLRDFGRCASDPSLVALAYNFGRYLLIASSRSSSSFPANLQGVWADGLTAPWSGDFHLNINLEMAYWSAASSNLLDSTEPLLAFSEKLSRVGKETAKKWYGVEKGWVAHGYTDSSGDARALGENRWALCVTCGAWLALTSFEITEFDPSNATRLKRALTVLEGAVEFFVDGYLFDYYDGHSILKVSGPSTSPENGYRFQKNNLSAWGTVATSPAIDVAILYRLFEAFDEGCQRIEKLLNKTFCDAGLRLRAKRSQKLLPNGGRPVPCADNLTFREYPLDGDSFDCSPDAGHRHFSGLWSVMPGRQEFLGSDLERARKTLNMKIMANSGHTGWSRAWAASLAARLQQPKEAETHIFELVSEYLASNLLATHPPLKPNAALWRQGCDTCYTRDDTFKLSSAAQVSSALRQLKNADNRGMKTVFGDVFQLDGNLGLTAAVHECLIQDLRGVLTHPEIHLLPALPPTWLSGQFLAVRLRGGFEIDLHWREAKVTQLTLRVLSDYATNLDLKSTTHFQFLKEEGAKSASLLSTPAPGITRLHNLQAGTTLELQSVS